MPTTKRKKNGQFNGSKGKQATWGSVLLTALRERRQGASDDVIKWERQQLLKAEQARAKAAEKRKTGSRKKKDDRPIFICGRCRIGTHDLQRHNDIHHGGKHK